MLIDKNMEELIQSYLDGEVSSEQRAFIEEKIATDKIWKKSYEGLLSVHQMLTDNLETMEPSMRFTKNVMEEIAGMEIARPVRMRQNPWIFRIAGGILGGLLMGILGYMFSRIDFSAKSSGSDLPVPDISLPQVNWTYYIDGNTTIFLFMICVILAMVMLEKLIFKGKNAA
jgi:hypothetical protein